MKVLLYADQRCDAVKQMVQALESIEFCQGQEYKNPFGNEIDFRYYIIAPEEVQDRQIPACLPNLIDDSNKHPQRTLFTYLADSSSCFFTQHQVKSLEAIGKMVEGNGAKWIRTLPQTPQQWEQAIAGEPQ